MKKKCLLKNRYSESYNNMRYKKGEPSAFKGKKHSEETKKKISESLKNRVITEANRKKMSDAHKGKPLTEAHKKKISEGVKKNSWNRGKTKETDSRVAGIANKLSKIYEGVIPDCAGWNKGKTKYDDVRIMNASKGMKESHIGKSSWNAGLTMETDERVAKQTINSQKAINSLSKEQREINNKKANKNLGISLAKNKYGTKIELKTIDLFTKYNINYKHQYYLKGKLFDFYLPDMNILVEIDGRYWHGKNIPDELIDLERDAIQRGRKNDYSKNRLAIENDYKLIRVWDDEIDHFENLLKNDFIGLEHMLITLSNEKYRYRNVA